MKLQPLAFSVAPLRQRAVVNIRWYSDEDSSDDEKKKAKVVKKNTENINKRLQELLNSMSAKPETTANIIKPRNRKKEAQEKKVEEVLDEKDIR